MLDPFDIARLQGCACGCSDMADELKEMFVGARISEKKMREVLAIALRLDSLYSQLHKLAEKAEKAAP